MRDQIKHFPVNWVDGMKINRNHFIAQDDAMKDALHDIASLNISPIKFGILPSSIAGENTFNVKLSLDNQNALRIAVLSCQAVTSGGIRIAIPALSTTGGSEADGVPSTSFQFAPGSAETTWWIFLTTNPFEKQPVGTPDAATPPRFPYVVPTYQIHVISESQYNQYANNPYALAIGKASVNGNEIRIQDEYIPPCYSVSAHPDLVTLHSELDQFLSNIELKSTQIVQKIFKKSQQNDLSELVLFLCDRMMLFVGQGITQFRWSLIHESPAGLFATISSLARVMKNTIDLRIGSGKEELMNYLSEWCELKQGELETMLTGIANMRYDNNDVNKNIQKIIVFVRVVTKLLDTLSHLDFIGKRKETGIFVKEEQPENGSFAQQQQKTKRRFFGN
jgi:hypothetical protein